MQRESRAGVLTDKKTQRRMDLENAVLQRDPREDDNDEQRHRDKRAQQLDLLTNSALAEHSDRSVWVGIVLVIDLGIILDVTGSGHGGIRVRSSGVAGQGEC